MKKMIMAILIGVMTIMASLGYVTEKQKEASINAIQIFDNK